MKADAIGIGLDDEDVLTYPPSIILYGPPGSGKTTLAAKSFQNMLWLTSEPDALRHFASELRDKPELVAAGFKMPARKYIPEFGPDGKSRIGNKDTLYALLTRFCQSVQEGTCPYEGIVLDQYNTFAARVYEEIKADAGYGKNKFARIDALKAWNSWICQIPRITGKVMMLLCHDAQPKYDEDENSPTHKQLLYKGGPAFPIGTERESMTAMSTVCLRLELGGGTSPTRSLITEASSLWHAKFRDAKIKPKEKLDLRELLVRAGYKL